MFGMTHAQEASRPRDSESPHGIQPYCPEKQPALKMNGREQFPRPKFDKAFDQSGVQLSFLLAGQTSAKASNTVS